ncbi:MAG: DUF2608 domain-containing protein [Pseudomonadota bacterium]
MIKHLTLAALFGCGLATAAASQPSVVATSAGSFAEMAAMAVTMSGGDLASLLIVMDDDDTLTQVPCSDPSSAETCQYLGGPAWYSWQESLLGSGSEYQVAQTSDDLISISSMIFGMMDMAFTDPGIATELAGLADGGAKMLVLTARGGSDVSPTQRQFADLPSTVSGQSFAAFIKSNGLTSPLSGLPSVASPVDMQGPEASCTSQRPVTYSDGVMYVAGQNKGTMLHCLLARTQSSGVQNIVFLDDTLANVTDVFTDFAGQTSGPNVLALHYTRLEAHKAALTVGDKADQLQATAAARWNTLDQALTSSLLSPIPALQD